MMIKLQGGIHDGLEMTVSNHLDVIDIPSGFKVAHGYATPITPSGIKHHSWDEGELAVKYERYRRTDRLTINEQVIYKAE